MGAHKGQCSPAQLAALDRGRRRTGQRRSQEYHQLAHEVFTHTMQALARIGYDGRGAGGLPGFIEQLARQEPQAVYAGLIKLASRYPLPMPEPEPEPEAVYETAEEIRAEFRRRGLPIPTLLPESYCVIDKLPAALPTEPAAVRLPDDASAEKH